MRGHADLLGLLQQRLRKLDAQAEEDAALAGPLGPTPADLDDWNLQARWELQRRHRRRA